VKSATLKPIQTRYKGYLMRSRLEARWAVYFDTLGVEWDYEPEGFDLGDAGLYLPDFWLKTVNMWAEVKPTPFTTEEDAKCVALALDSGYPVLRLEGTPAWREYYAWDACGIDNAGCFGPGQHFQHVIWIDYHLTTEYLSERRFFVCGDLPDAPDAVTASAIVAARSARFEHGQSGAPK